MYGPILYPGPNRPLDARAHLAQIIAAIHAAPTPIPTRIAPNMNAIHQQVSNLAHQISQARLPIGQASPYGPPTNPYVGGSPVAGNIGPGGFVPPHAQFQTQNPAWQQLIQQQQGALNPMSNNLGSPIPAYLRYA